MNFRKSLLDIYEKANNTSEKGGIREFVKNRIGNILELSFTNKELKDFYLANESDTEYVLWIKKQSGSFNFLKFIDFKQIAAKRQIEELISGLTIISKDSRFSAEANELIIEFKEIENNLNAGAFSKPELENKFKRMTDISQKFLTEQCNTRNLISSEVYKRKKYESDTTHDNLIPGYREFVQTYYDDSEILQESSIEAKSIIPEIHPSYMDFKSGKIASFQDIINKLDDSGNNLGHESIKAFFDKDGTEFEGDLQRQIMKLDSVIKDEKTSEESLREAIKLLKYNLNSFSTYLDAYLNGRVYALAKDGLGYLAKSKLTSFMGDVNDVIQVDKCLSANNVNDTENRKLIIERMVKKSSLSTTAYDLLKKMDFKYSREKIIEIGKVKIVEFMNYDENSKLKSEAKENLGEFAKSATDKLTDLGLMALDLLKKGLKIGFLSLGAAGVALIGLMRLIVKTFAHLIIGLRRLASLLALPFFKVPVPQALLDIIPPKWGGGLDFGEGLDMPSFGDIFRNILENGAFSSDLRNSFNNKSNDIDGQQNLRGNKEDKLKGVNVLNYEELKNGLLVGEIFIDFQDYKWKKEKIDFSEIHIMESFDAKTSKKEYGDYSFFLDEFKWSLKGPSDKPVILSLFEYNLRSGRNSVVCPRGYIPIISDRTKKYLEADNISYKLYCVKEMGYYYIELSSTPKYSLDFELRRYGDEKYSGIFFGKNNPTYDSRLTKSMLGISEMDDELKEFIDSTISMSDDEFMTAFESYSRKNYLYSLSYETTLEHQKYPTHLAGVAHSKKGDCKNINALAVGLARRRHIKARVLAGYVQSGTDEYNGHGICEVNEDGKCKLYDATPTNKENEEEGKANTVMEKMAESIADNMIKFRSLFKNVLSKVNLSYIMSKLEEKLSIFLAMKVLYKKKQIEANIINSSSGDTLPPALYDFMMLPDPTKISKKLKMKEFNKFLRNYLEILNIVENRLLGNFNMNDDTNKEKIEKKANRIKALKSISELLGVKISYEEFMDAYFQNIDNDQVKPLDEGNIKTMKTYFSETLNLVLKSKGISSENRNEKILRLYKILNYLGLESYYNTLMDHEEFQNSDAIKSVYLPLIPIDTFDEDEDSLRHFVINDKDTLIDNKELNKLITEKKDVKYCLERIYESFSGAAWSKEFENIAKDNFLSLLRETIDDILELPFYGKDFSSRLFRIVTNGKYGGGTLGYTRNELAPLNRLEILLQVINSLGNSDGTFSDLKEKNERLQSEGFNFEKFIKNNVIRMAQLLSYNENHGDDDFMNKIFLLLSFGIGIKKYDNCLCQKRFIAKPENIIFVLKSIVNDIAYVEKKIRSSGYNSNTYAYLDSSTWRYGNSSSSNREKLIKEKKELESLRDKLKNHLLNNFEDNTEVIFSSFEATGINSLEDRNELLYALKEALKNNDTGNEVYKIFIEILINHHIQRPILSLSGAYSNGIGAGYGNALEVLTRENIISLLSEVPGEALLEIGNEYLEADKSDIKKTIEDNDSYLDKRDKDNDKSKIYQLLISSLRRVRFKQGLDSMKAKRLIYKMEDRLNTLSYSAFRINTNNDY